MSEANLLVIVPTKGRPQLIRRLWESILSTAAEAVDVLLIVDESEQNTYGLEIFNFPHGFDHTIGTYPVADTETYPGKINLGGALSDGYDYVCVWNDEHEAITPGWDVAFKTALANEPFGLAYGPDGIWDDGTIPSAPCLTQSMWTTLGWIALPGLRHILVDNTWLELARRTGTIHFMPDYRIEHHHRQNGAPDDATYKLTNDNQELQDSDSKRYFTWLGSPEYWRNLRDLRELWTDRDNSYWFDFDRELDRATAAVQD